MRKTFILIALLLLAACEKTNTLDRQHMEDKNPIIEINLHEDIDQVISRSPLKFEPDCLPAVGVCWYEISNSANSKNLPTASIDSGKRRLLLKNAPRISTVISEQYGKKIENINISLRGLPDNSLHEDQQNTLYTIIEGLQRAGWKHYYRRSDPRISGKEMDKINTPVDVLGKITFSHPWLDPNYKIDLKRWLEIGSFYDWYFYNDNTYLHLRAWRRLSEEAPEERGTYLITLNFSTEAEFWRTHFQGKDKLRWKELLPEKLESYKQRRAEREDKARAAGIDIDETYQDPPIQALNE